MPSVPMLTLMPALHHLGHLPHLRHAVAHLQRRGRAVHDRDAVRGHRGQLLVVDMDAVGDGHIGPEHTELGQVDHRSLAELGDEPVRIELGRRHVEAHPDVVLGGQRARRPPERIGTGRVADEDRPGAETTAGDRSEVGELPLEMGDRLVRGLAVDAGLRRKVPDPAAQAAADPDLHQTVDDVVEKADRPRFQERRGARLEHLHRGELRGQAFLGRGVHGVQRAQPHEHVLLEGRVVRDVAPGERLAGDVDVRVDEPGRDHEAIAADLVGARVARRQIGRLAHGHDAVALDQHPAVPDEVPVRVHRHDVPTAQKRLTVHRSSTAFNANPRRARHGGR